jgi:hypothetical protein
MKTRSSWEKLWKATAVGFLAGGLLIFAGIRGSREQSIVKGGGSLWRTAKSSADRPVTRVPAGARVEAYANVPLSFDENVGQTARNVRFMSRGNGYGLFLTSQGAELTLHHSMAHNLSARHRAAYFRSLREARRAGTLTALRINLDGANPSAQVIGTDRLQKRVNYFLGNDPRNWRTDVPSFARVKYAGVYPGVDLIFYGNQRRLEYDFIVAPGGNPEAIQLVLQGAEKIRIGAGGDLILGVPGGAVAFQKPVIYQTVKGTRHKIAGGYSITKGNRIRFVVGKYDRSEPLIIDPVLNYSTYLGGSVNGDLGTGIAIDSNGNAFVTGVTFAVNFPTTVGSFMPGPLASNASGAVFVTEINSTGTQELYSTYLAGSGDLGDFGFGITVDGTGNVYVTGMTFSTDFPTTAANALKPGPLATNPAGTSFLTKLNPTANQANQLVYSSFIGGTNGDFANSIAVDANGNAYIAGGSLSNPGSAPGNFPVTAGAYQNTLNSLLGNAFLTRIDTTKVGNASLVYSTYLGGTGNATTTGLGYADSAFGIAVDSSSNAYLVGQTTSSDFPTTATGYQTQTAPPAAVTLGTNFMSRIDTTLSGAASLIYSTYLGGGTGEFGAAIALGPNNVASITGLTDSLTFPIVPLVGAYQTSSSGGSAFISLIDTGKSGVNSLVYSTYLGSGGVQGNGIKVDAAGNNYVVGVTSSSAFPIVPGAFQPAFAAGAAGEGFLSKLIPGGQGANDLIYSTLFGGSGSASGFDSLDGIAIDATNDAYVTGTTSSSNLPVFPNPGGFQTSLPAGDSSAAILAKLTLTPTLTVTPTSLNFGTQPVGVISSAKTVALTNNSTDPISFPGSSIAFTGTYAADFASPSNTCGGSIAAAASCNVSVTFTPSIAAPPSETATLIITVTITDAGVSGPQTFDVSLTGNGSSTVPGVGLAPTSLAFGNQALSTTSAAKTVTLTNTGTAALTIASIAASGDFTVSNNPCGANLAAGANCIISVTFTPTVLGARAGTLTITDNAGSGTQTVPLTGTGTGTPDFGLTGPAGVQGVTLGQTLNFNVTVTSTGGFNSPVALACTGAPMLATCTVTSPVTPPANSTIQAQVMMTTTALVPPIGMPTPTAPPQQVVPLVLALMLLFSLMWVRQPRLRLAMATAALMLLALTGCNGLKHQSTPKGAATLTITGTSTAPALTHNVPVQISVN